MLDIDYAVGPRLGCLLLIGSGHLLVANRRSAAGCACRRAGFDGWTRPGGRQLANLGRRVWSYEPCNVNEVGPE
jgi:hypothetical protein